MKLLGYKRITGLLELLTGLHIGAGSESTQIGGLDSPVIRLLHNNDPYIPGSSLKGKMRSLLELYLDKVGENGNVHKYTDACENGCPICYVFGAAAGDGAPIGPGRLVVRDATIDEDSEVNKQIREQSTGLPFSEEKTEISINRIKCSVDTGLRKTERVPAGTVFKIDMSFRQFEGDDAKLFDTVLLGLALIEKDALGGSGSRGYGKVRFLDLVDEKGEKIKLPQVETHAASAGKV